jgi:hypothetical protein
VIALSVLRSPPRSVVFIAVIVGYHWTPISPLSEVLPPPAIEADQASRLQVIEVTSWLTEVKPSTLLPLLP